MKFSVLTDDFKNSIEKAAKGMSIKAYFAIIEGIKIEVINNECFLYSTNLEQYIKTRIDIENINNQNDTFILQDVKQIMKALKFFKDFQIVFEIENNILKISCGNKKIEKTIMNDIDYKNTFPEMLIAKNENIYNYNAKELELRFNNIKYAIAKNDNRPILTGVHFNKNDMVTLDGFRLAMSKDAELTIEKPITIPFEGMKLFSSLLENNIIIQYDKTLVTMSDKDTTITSRLLEGEYMNYQGVIPSDSNIIFDFNTKDFMEELKYFNEISNVKNNMVGMYNEKLEIVTDSGKYKTEIKIENIADNKMDFPIFFNLSYMIDGLNQFDKKVICKIKNDISPIVLTDVNNSNLALVLPISSKRTNTDSYFTDLKQCE